MKKIIKSVFKTYLYVTSSYFTFVSVQLIISTYRKYKWAKENKSYIDSINEFRKILKDAGYFDKEV